VGYPSRLFKERKSMPNHVEIVREFHKRGGICQIDDLKQLIENASGELYRSLYVYDENIKEYIGKNESIANYPGTIYPDKIVLDFDGDKCREQAIAAFLKLDEMDVYNGYNIFFSGRGFHIELNSQLFNFEPTPKLNKVVQNTINKLFPDADNIFDKARIYRCVNTINNKSGLYKIPITRVELETYTMEKIREMAKEPRWEFDYDEDVVEPKLHSHIIYDKGPGASSTPKSNGYKTTAHGKFACIHNMYESTPTHGSRHDILMRLISHFKRQNYSQKMAYDLCKSWIGDNLEKEGRHQELTKILEDIYNVWEGHYTCQDPVMEKHCNPNCPFFKDIVIQDYDDMDSEFIRRIETSLFGFNLKDFWKGLLHDYKIEQNELISIHGATGMGKTAFMQNLIIKAKLPTLYFSLEMPAYHLHTRNLQIVANKSKEYVYEHYQELKIKHREELKHIRVNVNSIYANELPSIIESNQPKIIVIDHIGLMKSQYRDEYAMVKEITQTLRQVSIKYDVIIFMVNQVSRENAKATILGIHAGKGSGSIENDSNKVIAFNRTSRTSQSVHIQSTKDREGQHLDSQFDYNNESLRVDHTRKGGYNDLSSM
jgi:KaiC/GvpD/RAD55 family RecA-like ATPase